MPQASAWKTLFGITRCGLVRRAEDPERYQAAPPAAPAAPAAPATDPQFSYCYEANDAGYGPYFRGQDPEYNWYEDADGDGEVCE